MHAVWGLLPLRRRPLPQDSQSGPTLALRRWGAAPPHPHWASSRADSMPAALLGATLREHRWLRERVFGAGSQLTTHSRRRRFAVWESGVVPVGSVRRTEGLPVCGGQRLPPGHQRPSGPWRGWGSASQEENPPTNSTWGEGRARYRGDTAVTSAPRPHTPVCPISRGRGGGGRALAVCRS